MKIVKTLGRSVLFIFLISCLGVAYDANAATVGIIDPSSLGHFKAKFLTLELGSANTINFGKFTTQPSRNITVTDTELRGYAWGNGVGWIVVNCADTATGCSAINGNFKVANDISGNLSGYAWGENTGWINFGPFSNGAISRVKIDPITGYFTGTVGAITPGYAWSQNLGWIVFDCSDPSSCTQTDWTHTPPPPPPGVPIIVPPVVTPPPPPNPTPTPTPTPTPPPVVTPPTLPPATPPDLPPTPPVEPPVLSTPPSPTAPPGGTGVVPNKNGGQPGGTSLNPNTPWVERMKVFNLVQKQFSILPEPISRGIGILGMSVSLAAPIAIASFGNPFSLYDIGLIFARLWSLLLIAFGLKKRNPPWGTVYDSETKQPLDPVYVVLRDLAGNEVASAITDLDGRYGFAVPTGTYFLSVRKTNYEFPSKRLVGKDKDELYSDLYFGEKIVTTEDNSVIAKNIPMDAVNFDWNEYAKRIQHRMQFFKKREIVIRRVADILFTVGFIISFVAFLQAQTVYNTAIIALYLFLMAAKALKLGVKAKGAVVEVYTNEPQGFAIVRVKSPGTGQEVAHKVADYMGKYYCLLQNGSYDITIDKKLEDGSYQTIPADSVQVSTGHLNKTFEI